MPVLLAGFLAILAGACSRCPDHLLHEPDLCISATPAAATRLQWTLHDRCAGIHESDPFCSVQLHGSVIEVEFGATECSGISTLDCWDRLAICDVPPLAMGTTYSVTENGYPVDGGVTPGYPGQTVCAN